MEKIPVLLIEDNDNLRKALKNELELDDFSVYTTADSPSGIKAAPDYKFRLILLDVAEGMEDTVSKLKLNPHTSHIPIIILVEESSAEPANLASEMCADSYITKPFEKTDIAEIIKLKLENCEAIAEKSQGRNTPSILVIDDDRVTRKVIQHNLRLDGFKVYMADNGPSGISTARKFKPNVILLDIMMPEMDGIEVLVNLKWNKKTKNIPVLMLTSKKTIGDTEAAYARKADGYITKPFKAKDMISVIRRHLKK